MAIFLFFLIILISWSNLEAASNSQADLPEIIGAGAYSINYYLGTSVTLSCVITNIQENYQIAWRYDSNSVTIAIGGDKKISSCDRYSLSVEERSISTLTISDLKESDKGLYSCSIVLNITSTSYIWLSSRSAHSSFELSLPPWRISNFTTRLNKEGNTLILTCKGENINYTQIGWYQHNEINRTLLNIGIVGYKYEDFMNIKISSNTLNPVMTVEIRRDDIASIYSQHNFYCAIIKHYIPDTIASYNEEWECKANYSEFVGEQIEIENSTVQDGDKCADPYNMTCFSYRNYMINNSIEFDIDRSDDYALTNNLADELNKTIIGDTGLESKILLKIFYQKCLKQDIKPAIQDGPRTLATGKKGKSQSVSKPKPPVKASNSKSSGRKNTVKGGSSGKSSGKGEGSFGGSDASASSEYAPNFWSTDENRFDGATDDEETDYYYLYYDDSDEEQQSKQRPNRLINKTRNFFDEEEQSLDDMRELNKNFGLLPFLSESHSQTFDFSKVLLYLSQLDIQPLLRIETKTNPDDATKLDIYILPGHLLLEKPELNHQNFLERRLNFIYLIKDVYKVYAKIMGEESITDYGEIHFNEESKLAQFWLENLASDSSFQNKNISELNEVLGFNNSSGSPNIEINWKTFLLTLIPPQPGKEYDDNTEVFVSSAFISSSSQTMGDFVRNMTYLDHYLSLYWTREIGMELSSELREAYGALYKRPNHFLPKEIHCVNLAANVMDASVNKMFNDVENVTHRKLEAQNFMIKHFAEHSTHFLHTLIDEVKLDGQTKQHLKNKLSSIYWDISPRNNIHQLVYRSYYYEDFAPPLPEGQTGVNFVTELAESSYMEMVTGLRFARRQRKLLNFTKTVNSTTTVRRDSGYVPLSSEVHYDVFAETIQISTGVYFSQEFSIIRADLNSNGKALSFSELFATVGQKILKALLKYLMHGKDFESKYDISDRIYWDLSSPEDLSCFQTVEHHLSVEVPIMNPYKDTLITENFFLKLAYKNYELYLKEKKPSSSANESAHEPFYQTFFEVYGKTKCEMKLMDKNILLDLNFDEIPPRVTFGNSFKRSNDYKNAFHCPEQHQGYYYTCSGNPNVTYNLTNWYKGLAFILFR